MGSWDYPVGFKAKPKNLEGFLKEQGYQRDRKNVFVSTDGQVDVFYHSKATIANKDEEEVPDWSESGHKIISDMEVTTKNPNSWEEAERLVHEIVKRYDAVSYEIGLGYFFGKKDI